MFNVLYTNKEKSRPAKRRCIRFGVKGSGAVSQHYRTSIINCRLLIKIFIQGCNRHLFTPNFSRRAFPCGQLHNTDNFLLRNVLLPNGPKDIKLHTFPTFLLQIVFLLNPAKCQISYNRYPYLYNKSTSLLWTVPS